MWGYSPHSNSWQTSPLYQRSHSSQVEAHNNYLYHYYQTDRLGTPLRMTTATNHHRFPGQYYDVETGLHYNYFRDYESSIGRYVQRDPIGLDGGINVYGYVGGNPVVFSDGKGLRMSASYPPQSPTATAGEEGVLDKTKGEAGTVTCDGNGGMMVRADPNVPPCLYDCLIVHENRHIQQISQINPNVCNGAARYAGIDIRPASHVYAMEKEAYATEKACLQAKLNNNSCDECAEEWKDRISSI